MTLFRVWRHDSSGASVAGERSVEAASAREAAEQVIGQPLKPHGPLVCLRARVVPANKLAAKYTEAFFAANGTAAARLE